MKVTMQDHDGLAADALIGDLYGSATDRESAIRAPADLATLLGGSVAAFWTIDPATIAVVGGVTTNLPPEAVQLYTEHYYRHDPFSGAVAQAPRNSVFQGAEYASDAAYACGAYYNEFGMRFGMFHMIGALMPLGSAREVGAVSILRPRHLGPFDASAVARLEGLLPHVRGALRLRTQIGLDRLEHGARETEAILKALPAPALVLDAGCRILHCNQQAHRSGLMADCLTIHDNRTALRLPDRAMQNRLVALVADAACGGAGGVVRLDTAGHRFVATLTPIADADGRTPGKVLMVLKALDQDRSGSIRQVAIAAFGMTTAEAAASAALAVGLAPEQIADQRKVKISTIRTLLKRAQDKADARTLRDLVRILIQVSA